MFDKMTKKLAVKMGRSVQEAAKPIQTEVSKVANNKVDLWSKVLKFGVLVLLFVDGTRRVVNDNPSGGNSGPSTIVINNYVDSGKNPRNQNYRRPNRGSDHQKGGR